MKSDNTDCTSWAQGEGTADEDTPPDMLMFISLEDHRAEPSSAVGFHLEHHAFITFTKPLLVFSLVGNKT